MYRRTFLKSAAMAATGVLTTGATPVLARSFGRMDLARGSFSLNVATDTPDASIPLVDRFLRESGLAHFSVRVETRNLPGDQLGDVVFFDGTSLVDYRSATNPLAGHLRKLASRHGFPRSLTNSVLLQYTGSNRDGSSAPSVGATATTADLIQDNVLIGRIPLARDINGYRVEGAHGHVSIAVRDGSIRIVDASCRHKTCVNMGAVNRPGEALACIPGRITIVLDGESGIDGISM